MNRESLLMKSAMYNVLIYFLLVATIIGLLIFLFFGAFKYADEVEETTSPNAPFSENCTFLKKVIGGDFVISEPKSGTFRYQLYATSEGIEVWKCSSF